MGLVGLDLEVAVRGAGEGQDRGVQLSPSKLPLACSAGGLGMQLLQPGWETGWARTAAPCPQLPAQLAVCQLL